MAKDTNGCLDWDDEIESDSQEFVILPEGDYNFTVKNFERGHFPGGAKIPPCNKAGLTLQIHLDDGSTASVKTDLILHKSLEWKLSSFFRCIGQKEHGERLKMDWSKVPGARGRAHFKPREYTDKDGKQRQANDVDKFLDFDEKFFQQEVEWKEVDSNDEEELPF